MLTDKVLSSRCDAVDVSGIRRVFHLGAKLKNPINLSIGQPDFPVPDPVKDAAIDAIRTDKNGYTLTTGIPQLERRIREHLESDLGWPADNTDEIGVVVTSGTSGALYLLNLALMEPGAEIIIPDPYFVAYPHMATICGGKAVRCDTYPDFRMTADRVAPLINENTRAVLLNSPGNPSGVVMSKDEVNELAKLCADKGVLLISDEIYDEFVYSDATDGGVFPSPARVKDSWKDLCVIRGFGKTYGCTGWRMGYIAGPKWFTEQIAKFQQYTYVCAPAPFQHGCLATFDTALRGIASRALEEELHAIAAA